MSDNKKTGATTAPVTKTEEMTVDIKLPNGYEVLGLSTTIKDGVDLSDKFNTRNQFGAKYSVTGADLVTEMKRFVPAVSALLKDGWSFLSLDTLIKENDKVRKTMRFGKIANINLKIAVATFKSKDITYLNEIKN